MRAGRRCCQPFYLYGPMYPGGKAFNAAAFTSPPTAPCLFGLCPTRQGDLSRNFLRGFGSTQWDFAVHRDFPIHESVKLQFRAEMFNLLNHPNFGPPSGNLGGPGALIPQFGLSSALLGQSLAGGQLGMCIRSSLSAWRSKVNAVRPEVVLLNTEKDCCDVVRQSDP